jgi:hypothetical protein
MLTEYRRTKRNRAAKLAAERAQRRLARAERDETRAAVLAAGAKVEASRRALAARMLKRDKQGRQVNYGKARKRLAEARQTLREAQERARLALAAWRIAARDIPDETARKRQRTMILELAREKRRLALVAASAPVVAPSLPAPPVVTVRESAAGDGAAGPLRIVFAMPAPGRPKRR